MREGTVFKRLTAGQRVARKVLRAQVGANLAVVAHLQVIRQVRAFADERNAAVQPTGFQLVRRHIIAIANLAVLADDDLFIQDRLVNYAAGTNDCVEEHDGVTDNRALLDDHTGRERTMFDLSLDDTAMRDQALDDLRPAANTAGCPPLPAVVTPPRW